MRDHARTDRDEQIATAILYGTAMTAAAALMAAFGWALAWCVP